MVSILTLIILVLVYELLAHRREHRQLSSIHALKRQALSLDAAMRKNGHGLGKRRHSRNLQGLS